MYQPTILPMFHLRAYFKFKNANLYCTHHRTINNCSTRHRLSAASRWLIFLNSNFSSLASETPTNRTHILINDAYFRSLSNLANNYPTHLWLKCWRECSFIFIFISKYKTKNWSVETVSNLPVQLIKLLYKFVCSHFYITVALIKISLLK